MEDTCGSSNCDFTKMVNKHENEACKLILIGLEGVGKTTLLNQACGKEFDTSDGRDGCSVKEDQKGSFTVDGFSRHYELIDMLGVNYKEPGEWQRTLHDRSHVHGVIFYISGANPRDSALGEVPRINEYCSNLKIPVLYIYRDGLLRFKPCVRIHAETSENSSQVDYTTETVTRINFKCYTNLDEVKRIIAQTFERAETSHRLLDPIKICGQVQELREDNQRLEAIIKALNEETKAQSALNKKELIEQKKKYDEQISCLNKSLSEATRSIQTLQEAIDRSSLKNQEVISKLGNDIQVSVNENQRLRLSFDALREANIKLERKYSKLDEDKRSLDFLYHDMNQKCNQLQTARQELENGISELNQQKNDLQAEKDRLQVRKDHLEQRINEASSYLENSLQVIVNVVHAAPGERSRIHSKKFDGAGKWMWLPLRAYEVIEEYDKLGNQVKTVVNALRSTFQMMNNQEALD